MPINTTLNEAQIQAIKDQDPAKFRAATERIPQAEIDATIKEMQAGIMQPAIPEVIRKSAARTLEIAKDHRGRVIYYAIQKAMFDGLYSCSVSFPVDELPIWKELQNGKFNILSYHGQNSTIISWGP